MKVITTIRYKGQDYSSEEQELENSKEIDSIVQKAVSGDLDYLTIYGEHVDYFFGKEVLKECLIFNTKKQ